MHKMASNSTQLVFCRENVDPDIVSKLLDMAPSEAVRVGELIGVDGRASHLGIWKLDLPNSSEQTVEEQISRWVALLRPNSTGLSRLRDMGYAPYLDCQAEAGSLSLCIEPDSLVSLGQLKISLSIWLYEKPRAQPDV